MIFVPTVKLSEALVLMIAQKVEESRRSLRVSSETATALMMLDFIHILEPKCLQL